MGIIAGSLWGFFWAILFLAIGLRLLMKNGKCPMCGWGAWQGKMHGKIHEKMPDSSCCGSGCDCECDCGHNHTEEN